MAATTEFATAAGNPEFAQALAGKLVGFSRLLRRHGFTVGVQETQDAFRIAGEFLCTDFAAFRSGLCSLFCLSEREYAPFGRLFEGYWSPADGTRTLGAEPRAARISRTTESGIEFTLGVDDRPEPRETGHTTSGASSYDRLSRVDFSRIAPHDHAELYRLAERLWRRMRLNLARRLRGNQWKKRLHFRRTMRRNLALGGDPVYLVYGGRRPRKPRLLVLLDVSGSMELYSLLLLRLIHALQSHFRHVSSFVFSTRLADVSKLLASPDPERALSALSRKSFGWHGGTRIGECLADLIAGHGRKVFRSDTVMLILSDGLDTGEPEGLARALGAIRRRVRKVIWLNPLLGLEGYEPVARGMQAALPHVDVFAPAHNLESLLDIERHLL